MKPVRAASVFWVSGLSGWGRFDFGLSLSVVWGLGGLAVLVGMLSGFSRGRLSGWGGFAFRLSLPVVGVLGWFAVVVGSFSGFGWLCGLGSWGRLARRLLLDCRPHALLLIFLLGFSLCPQGAQGT